MVLGVAGVDSTNTLNMSGNASATIAGLWMGTLTAGTVNTINMSDTASLLVTSGLEWGQDNGTSTGSITMADDAVVYIYTNLVAAGWENTRIIAANAEDYIATNSVDDYIEYTVVAPEPDLLHWGGGANPSGGDTSWTNGLGWYSAVTFDWDHVPNSLDQVVVQKFLQGGGADTSTWVPTLDTAGAASLLNLSINASASGTQIAQLDLVGGASLVAQNVQFGGGTASNSVNTLNLSSNATMSVDGLWLGSLAADTDNTINMSGTSSATVTAGLWWGQENGKGVGLITLADDAVLSIATVLTSNGWENTRITAYNVGETISSTNLPTGYTEYKVDTFEDDPDILHWGGGANAGGDTSWTNGLGWYSAITGDWDHVPTYLDTVVVQKFFQGGAADTSTWIPTLDTAGGASIVYLSINASASGTQTAQLDLVGGANLTVQNIQFGVGDAVNSTNTVNMSSNATMTVGGLWLGSLAAGTVNTINMDDTSALQVDTALLWGQDNVKGTGAIVMDGGATLKILTGAAGAGWENTRITALNAVTGDYIQRTDLGSGYSEYTVIPVPPLVIGDIAFELLPGGNDLTLTWTTINPYSYTVESKISLIDPVWSTNATGIVGTGGDITVTTAVDQAQSFFRVVGE